MHRTVPRLRVPSRRFSDIPSQRGDLPPAADPYFQPDIRQMDRELRALEGAPQMQRLAERGSGVVTKPTGVRLMPGTFVFPNALPALNLQGPVLQQNSRRKRLIVPNLDINIFTIYMSFGNFPKQNWLPVAPGGVWDESNSSIVTEEIWFAVSAGGAVIGYWEGIEDVYS